MHPSERETHLGWRRRAPDDLRRERARHEMLDRVRRRNDTWPVERLVDSGEVARAHCGGGGERLGQGDHPACVSMYGLRNVLLGLPCIASFTLSSHPGSAWRLRSAPQTLSMRWVYHLPLDGKAVRVVR